MPAFSNDPPSIALGDVRTSAIDDVQLYIAQINTSASRTDYEEYVRSLWYALVDRSHALPGAATSEEWQWWWQARRKCYQRMGLPFSTVDVTWEMATKDAVWRGPTDGTTAGSNGQSGNDWLGAANFAALLTDDLDGYSMWEFGGTIRVWHNDGVTGFFDQSVAQPRPIMGSNGGDLEVATPTWNTNTWRLDGPRSRTLFGQLPEDFRVKPFLAGMETHRTTPVVCDTLNGAPYAGVWPPSTQPTGLYLDKHGTVRLAPAGEAQWVLGTQPNQFTFYARDSRTLYRYDGGGWVLDEVRNISETEASAYATQWGLTNTYAGRMRSEAMDASTFSIRDDFTNKADYAFIPDSWPDRWGPKWEGGVDMGASRRYGQVRQAGLGRVWDCGAAARTLPDANNQTRDFDLLHVPMPSQWGRIRVRFLDLPTMVNPADTGTGMGLEWINSAPVPKPTDYMRKCYPALRVEGWVTGTDFPAYPWPRPFWYVDVPVGYLPPYGYLFDATTSTSALHDTMTWDYDAGRTEIVAGQNYEVEWFDDGGGNMRIRIRQFAGDIGNIINPIFTATLMDRTVPLPTNPVTEFGINFGHGAWQTEHFRPSDSTQSWHELDAEKIDASIEEVWIKAD